MRAQTSAGKSQGQDRCLLGEQPFSNGRCHTALPACRQTSNNLLPGRAEEDHLGLGSSKGCPHGRKALHHHRQDCGPPLALILDCKPWCCTQLYWRTESSRLNHFALQDASRRSNLLKSPSPWNAGPQATLVICNSLTPGSGDLAETSKPRQ